MRLSVFETVLILTLCATMVLGRDVMATSRYVDINRPAAGSQDGLTWGTAYQFLAPAISDAEEDDIILIADGTYYPHHILSGGVPVAGTNRNLTFEWKRRVTIRGGYRGNLQSGESGDPDDNNPALHVTIVSGNIGDPAVETDNTTSILTLEPTGSLLAWTHSQPLFGGTIREGYSEVDQAPAIDPAISETPPANTYPRVHQCVIEENTQTYSDGYVSGAVCVSGYGGSASDHALEFRDCNFQNNSTTAEGGAIFITTVPGYGARVAIVRSTFAGNEAESVNSFGGGAIGIDPILLDVGEEMHVCVVNSDLRENSTSAAGGAIAVTKFHSGGDLFVTVAGSVLAANTAGTTGGAIRFDGGTSVVRDCAIADNVASNSGGGIDAAPSNGSTGPTLDVANSIVFFNTAPVDPLFVDDGDYRLGADRPCKDVGSDTLIPADTFDVDDDANRTEPLPLDIALAARVRCPAVEWARTRRGRIALGISVETAKLDSMTS